MGKGSFAQVVKAFDHKLKTLVALKINRNTEIDHNFAESEHKLLQTIMKQDPHDTHNIVRMLCRHSWRGHSVFVFELLEKDLFQCMQERNFEGFSVNTVKAFVK